MSAAIADLAASVAHNAAFRIRIAPLFAQPGGVPLRVLAIIDAMLETAATGATFTALATAMQQASLSLRILEQWAPAVAFARLAADLDQEAERRP